jgi:hypothetical protein
MRMWTTVVAVAALAVLAGCGRDDARGELTAEENRQLDEAEGMLKENGIDVSPDSLVANEAELDAMVAEENAAANIQ